MIINIWLQYSWLSLNTERHIEIFSVVKDGGAVTILTEMTWCKNMKTIEMTTTLKCHPGYTTFMQQISPTNLHTFGQQFASARLTCQWLHGEQECNSWAASCCDLSVYRSMHLFLFGSSAWSQNLFLTGRNWGRDVKTWMTICGRLWHLERGASCQTFATKKGPKSWRVSIGQTWTFDRVY